MKHTNLVHVLLDIQSCTLTFVFISMLWLPFIQRLITIWKKVKPLLKNLMDQCSSSILLKYWRFLLFIHKWHFERIQKAVMAKMNHSLRVCIVELSHCLQLMTVVQYAGDVFNFCGFNKFTHLHCFVLYRFNRLPFAHCYFVFFFINFF